MHIQIHKHAYIYSSDEAREDEKNVLNSINTKIPETDTEQKGSRTQALELDVPGSGFINPAK